MNNTCKQSSKGQSRTEESHLKGSSSASRSSKSTIPSPKSQTTQNSLSENTEERLRRMSLLGQIAGLLPLPLQGSQVPVTCITKRPNPSTIVLLEVSLSPTNVFWGRFFQNGQEYQAVIQAELLEEWCNWYVKGDIAVKNPGARKAEEWFTTTPAPQDATKGRW